MWFLESVSEVIQGLLEIFLIGLGAVFCVLGICIAFAVGAFFMVIPLAIMSLLGMI